MLFASLYMINLWQWLEHACSYTDSLFFLPSCSCFQSWRKKQEKLILINGKYLVFAFFLQAARRRIPILVDAERVREGLDDLLKLADYAICSKKFPQASWLFFINRCLRDLEKKRKNVQGLLWLVSLLIGNSFGFQRCWFVLRLHL